MKLTALYDPAVDSVITIGNPAELPVEAGFHFVIAVEQMTYPYKDIFWICLTNPACGDSQPYKLKLVKNTRLH